MSEDVTPRLRQLIERWRATADRVGRHEEDDVTADVIYSCAHELEQVLSAGGSAPRVEPLTWQDAEPTCAACEIAAAGLPTYGRASHTCREEPFR